MEKPTIRIRNDWNGNTFELVTTSEFINRINNKIPTYEVIDDILKYNFDVDFYCNKEDYDDNLALLFETQCYTYIYDALKTYTNIEPIIIKSTSHTNNYDGIQGKYSVRFYVTNMKDTRENMKSFVKNLNISVNNMPQEVLRDCIEIKEYFDESIYSPLKKIRCINTSKPGENRPLILQTGNIEGTILNNVEGCYAVNYCDPNIKINIPDSKSSSPTSVTEIKKFTDEDYEEYLDYAKLIDKNSIGFHIKKRLERFKFITASKNIGIPINIIQSIMCNVPNYDENKVEETYNQVNKGDKIVGWNTIKKMANDSNQEAKKLLDVKYYSRKHFNIDLYSPLFTSGLIADYFKTLYKGKFISVHKVVYSFNGIFWEKDDDLSILTNFVDKTFVINLLEYANYWTNRFTTKMTTANTSEAEELKNKIEKINALRGNINTMRKVGVRKSIMEDIITFITNNKIEFDDNPYLFAFNNCVFDLRTGNKIQPTPEQYVSKTCGYDYDEKYDKQNIEDLNKLIAEIFPDKDTAEYCKSVLSTGLCGIQQEYCFVFTGVGGNGKGVINSLMMKMLGSYGYVLPSVALLTEIKVGANPELYNLNKARFVIASEPNAKMKIKCATLKTITGEPTLPVRDHYSSKVGATMSLTLVMEANDVPLLDEVNQAMMRRMRMVLFNSLYVDKATYDTLDDKTNVYLSNPYYKTDSFKNKYKQAMFQILLQSFQEFHKNNNTMPDMPLQCKTKCRDYMAVSDDIYGWFNCAFKKNENATPIALTDVYKVFSTSEFYNNLSKNDKRIFNRKAFIEKIEKNIFLRRCIVLRDKYYKSIQLKADSIVGWELINDDNGLDEEDIV